MGETHPVLVEVPLCSPIAREKEIRGELDGEVGVRVPEETRAELAVIAIEDPASFEAVGRLRGAMELVAPKVALAARIETQTPAGPDDESLQGWLDACHRLDLKVTDPDQALPGAMIDRILRAASVRRRAVLVEVGPPPDAPRDSEAAVDLALAVARLGRGIDGASLMLGLAPVPDRYPLQPYRLLAARLAAEEMNPPLVIIDDASQRSDDPLLGASLGVGGLLCDGLGDAIQLRGQPDGEARKIAFSILQAARVRITRTEFISCPSCGRTLFDLEETTARIKSRTSHLKGVKIAVMGCVVNGPGEMADADFGYVGWGEEKIALFVGKEMVAKDIPTGEADDRLVELIKEHGRWIDPPVAVGETR